MGSKWAGFDRVDTRIFQYIIFPQCTVKMWIAATRRSREADPSDVGKVDQALDFDPDGAREKRRANR